MFNCKSCGSREIRVLATTTQLMRFEWQTGILCKDAPIVKGEAVYRCAKCLIRIPVASETELIEMFEKKS